MSPEATLLDLIANTLGIDTDELTPDARFDELGRTSAQELELYVEIEDQLGVTIAFTEFSLMATVGEVVDAVLANASGSGNAAARNATTGR